MGDRDPVKTEHIPAPMDADEPSRHDNSNNNNNNNNNGDGDVIGSAALRPVFLGNLSPAYSAEDVVGIFERPILPPGTTQYKPIPVDRIDLKRGYCFVFLKDARTEDDKVLAERFVSDINGMVVPNVTSALRAEFARGDGRVKRKEDERRKRIQPSETLFVVNFHEETTKREDLRMLFEPYGELIRIEMKRNYAFVQFRTVEEATRAKDEVNGGKLDQSVLTVEFVAQQRGEPGRMPRRDFRAPRRGPPPRDRYERRSPPRHRGRSRSRSRSPPMRYRSRSPRGRDYYDGGRGFGGGMGGGYGNRSSPEPYRGRRSPDRDYRGGGGDRGFDRDRGYRP